MVERDDFEEQVREGMQRCEPPAGFADRVMLRVAKEPSGAPKLRLMKAKNASVWQWAVAAALLLAVSGGVLEQRHLAERRARQIAGEQARDQLMTALQITSEQLQRVNQQINRQE